MKGCIANPHWDACKSCRNFNKPYGCNVKEEILLVLKDCKYIICEDYEERKEPTNQQEQMGKCPRCGLHSDKDAQSCWACNYKF
jgi:hypothetical protein